VDNLSIYFLDIIRIKVVKEKKKREKNRDVRVVVKKKDNGRWHVIYIENKSLLVS